MVAYELNQLLAQSQMLSLNRFRYFLNKFNFQMSNSSYTEKKNYCARIRRYNQRVDKQRARRNNNQGSIHGL